LRIPQSTKTIDIQRPKEERYPVKFLVTVTPKDTQLPPPAIAQILARQRDWINEKRSAGTGETAYAFPGGGGFNIVNAESAEALHAMLLNAPAFPIATFTVQPLADISTALSSSVETLERAAQMAAH
jgi:muconolactone delta-isomerase